MAGENMDKKTRPGAETALEAIGFQALALLESRHLQGGTRQWRPYDEIPLSLQSVVEMQV